MKVILVQLADEAGKIAVFEMFGQDGFGESLILGQVRFVQPHSSQGDVLRGPQNYPLRRPIAPLANRMDPRAFLIEIQWSPLQGCGWYHTCKAFVPGSSERTPPNTRSRPELTKSLELFAPAAPTPMLESMLSSSRIGFGGRSDIINDGVGQDTADGDGVDKVKPSSM